MENLENKDVEVVEAAETVETAETVEEVVETPVTEEEPAKKKANILAILALVSGILSIVFNCCCGWLSIPFGLGAFILGIVSPKNENGKKSGMAIAGIICGIAAIVLFIVSLVASILFPAIGTLLSEVMYY